MGRSDENKVGFKDVVASVLASFLGVQRRDNYERDFSHGKAHHYIIVGLVGTVMFVLIVWGVVQLVLHLAGV